MSYTTHLTHTYHRHLVVTKETNQMNEYNSISPLYFRSKILVGMSDKDGIDIYSFLYIVCRFSLFRHHNMAASLLRMKWNKVYSVSCRRVTHLMGSRRHEISSVTYRPPYGFYQIWRADVDMYYRKPELVITCFDWPFLVIHPLVVIERWHCLVKPATQSITSAGETHNDGSSNQEIYWLAT